MKGDVNVEIMSSFDPFGVQLIMTKQISDLNGFWYITRIIGCADLYYLDTPMRNRLITMIIDEMAAEMKGE